jgi:IclR family acetate operon transcriptional repressor
MSKSSMHGLLKTLESLGAVEQDENRRYFIGQRIYDLARTYAQRVGLRRLALPAMERLAASIGETILLGRVEQNGVRIRERVESPDEQPALRVAARVGMRIPLLAGAVGRVVLASWPSERRMTYLRAKPLPHFTPQTITDPDQYLATVSETVESGIALDHEEYLAGVNAVAAPIYGPGDELVAILWAVGYSARFVGAALEQASQLIHDEAQAISRALGASQHNAM